MLIKLKKITFLVMFAFAWITVSVTIGFADTINVGNEIRLFDGPGTTNGGEFQLFMGGEKQFNTFCLETTEFFTYGEPLTVVGITDTAYNGSVGPTGDLLNYETAYLYTMFRNGSLTRLNDTPYSSNPDNSANALQAAIWYFEGERPKPAEGTLADRWVDEAIAAGWSNIGNVRVLNLINARGGRAQDQLVLVPEPSTLLILGAGLLGLGIFGRKRFKRKS